MAQIVGFFEDFDTPEREAEAYSEGPFVVVNALGSGFRIECEVRGGKCPVLPDTSVYKYAEAWRRNILKTDNLDAIKDTCDWLNTRVKAEDIILVGRTWVSREFINFI